MEFDPVLSVLEGADPEDVVSALVEAGYGVDSLTRKLGGSMWDINSDRMPDPAARPEVAIDPGYQRDYADRLWQRQKDKMQAEASDPRLKYPWRFMNDPGGVGRETLPEAADTSQSFGMRRERVQSGTGGSHPPKVNSPTPFTPGPPAIRTHSDVSRKMDSFRRFRQSRRITPGLPSRSLRMPGTSRRMSPLVSTRAVSPGRRY